MTVREQLNQELSQAPDTLLEEVLNFLRSRQALIKDQTNTALKKSVLERMGGMPQYLLSNGKLSDRDQRRAKIAERLQKRHQRPKS